MSLQRRSDDRDYKKNPLTRADTQIFFDPEKDKSLTQQHHNEGNRLDTTAIISQFFKNGVITHTRDQAARYIDTVHYQDFAQMMNVKVRADAAFENVNPKFLQEAGIESQEEFVAYCLDEKNLDTLRKYGLANPIKGPAAPVEVKIVAPIEESPEPKAP